jgi:dinuclear metal center YbgI/SA1388 family protein
MATSSPSSAVDLKDLLKVLQKFAPLQLAEKWDNVGLLIEPLTTNITNILLTIDLTEAVVEEAIQKNVNFILSYHPPVFEALKRITMSTTKQRIVVKCISNSIAVYSPHTSFDVVKGGINDWLASGLGKGKVVAIKPSAAATGPLPEILEEGLGRIVTLAEPVTLSELVCRIKSHLGLERLRLATGDTDRTTVSTIAICAGSGGSLLKGVPADVWFTGEMSHHDVLAAVAEGTSIVLCEHTNTERGFLKHRLLPLFAQELLPSIGAEGVKVHVSEVDADPLVIV